MTGLRDELEEARLDAGTDPVAKWQLRLAERVAMTDPERVALRTELLAYCERHAVTPTELLATWQDYPDLTVRRRPGAPEPPNLAVESFLIHNGVNVFGEIVCVAGNPADLAAQGPWFVRR